ncbi:MAG: beta-glucuronidase, partial [Niabella sp.]
GFQLLGLQDFPGQGTALVGVVNVFYQPKGYISPQQFKQFCNSTVPLSRIEKFVYTNNETFKAAIELFHYEEKPLHASISWLIKDESGTIVKKGNFTSKTYPVGNCLPVGNIVFPLQDIKKAKMLTLEVKVDNTPYTNDWDFWVYPKNTPQLLNETSIYYTDTLDKNAEKILNEGGKVFLNAAGKVVKGKEIVQQFLPIFWNTSWFKMRPPHTLGILLNNQHPAFKYFPTSYYSNLQWWEIVNKAQVMHLEDFPKSFRLLVQPIDTWFMNRRLGLIFETKVGKGKLMVSSADLQSNLQERPAAKQLLYSLQQYMLSPNFNPANAVNINLVRDLFTSPSKFVWDAFTKDSPDELKAVKK